MKISNVIVGFLSTAAVIALGGVSIGAAEQAMFVLNSGERHSGTLVYGRGSNNIVDERFHLNVSDREHTFGLNDVAVIEFDGGRPTSAERQSVATDTTAVMVMRNGSVQRGHLHNIIGGDLVQWVNEAGQRNNYPIRDISRLYLNPQRALAVFLSSPGAPTGVTAAQGGIRVDANQAWAETGMVVRRGDRVIFNATGDITRRCSR